MSHHVQRNALVLLAALAACGSPSTDLSGGDGGVIADAGASQPVDAGQPGEGLPCNVKDFLLQNCAGCHGETLQNGAVGRLMSRGDLLALSPYGSGKTMAERSLERMAATSGTMPPPPASALSPADQGVLSTYVNAGMPDGTCAPGPVPTVCSSNIHWTLGDLGSSLMNPGLACISCHLARQDGPLFAAAGTLYPSAHEDDRCRGTPSVTVRITDANGVEHVATSNQAGNFSFGGSIPKPYTAQVESGGRVRAMATPQVDGDCNSCHTVQGNRGAAGRIVIP